MSQEENRRSLEESLQDALREWRLEKKGGVGLGISGVFVFPAAFPGFAGHFPARPILPAIVQLAAVRHLAQLGLAGKLQPTACRQVKFRGIIQPQDEVVARVDLCEQGKIRQARFSLRKAGAEVAGGVLELISGICPTEE